MKENCRARLVYACGYCQEIMSYTCDEIVTQANYNCPVCGRENRIPFYMKGLDLNLCLVSAGLLGFLIGFWVTILVGIPTGLFKL